MNKLCPTVILAVLCAPPVGVRAAGDDAPKSPVPGVQAKLVVSVEEYDPFKPSKGIVKCVVVNKSGDPVEVAIGYDGRLNGLSAQGSGHQLEIHLFPAKPWKDEPKRVKLKSGEEQVIFELPLDDILFQGKDDPKRDKDRLWRWEWFLRAEPPNSPIHRWREKGFVESATFWAEALVNDKAVRTEKTVLKIKLSTPEPE